MMAWKRGVKSLYYCRSLSIQRADAISEKVDPLAETPRKTAPAPVRNYEECLACQ
jgi:ribonucleoside-diphosphate reductase alpha chain